MDNNIEKPEDLFKVLGIENLDINALKADIYSLLKEASDLSNSKEKNEISEFHFTKLLEDVEHLTDLNETLRYYIFVKWILATVKEKLEITPGAREESQLMSEIKRKFSNSEKIAEFLNKSQDSQKEEKVASKEKITLPDLEEDFDFETHEWDLSRYAYKGEKSEYDIRYRIRINPKMRQILNLKKEKISAFLVGDFTVGRDGKDGAPATKARKYKMLTVVNGDDVYMIVGKFDEDDIRENPNFYRRNMFSKWNLKNADTNNFGFPGVVTMDEDGYRRVIYNFPGCEDLVEALSIAREQHPEIFCSFNKKMKNRKSLHSTPGAQGEEGGR